MGLPSMYTWVSKLALTSFLKRNGICLYNVNYIGTPKENYTYTVGEKTHTHKLTDCLQSNVLAVVFVDSEVGLFWREITRHIPWKYFRIVCHFKHIRLKVYVTDNSPWQQGMMGYPGDVCIVQKESCSVNDSMQVKTPSLYVCLKDHLNRVYNYSWNCLLFYVNTTYLKTIICLIILVELLSISVILKNTNAPIQLMKSEFISRLLQIYHLLNQEWHVQMWWACCCCMISNGMPFSNPMECPFQMYIPSQRLGIV